MEAVKARGNAPSKGDYDPYSLPDYDTEFITNDELEAFAQALAAPTTAPVIALNDWRPVHQKIKKPKRRKVPRRSKDETREGFVYTIVYWPLLLFVLGWIIFLFIAYDVTRLYIYAYEHIFSWTGKRQALRRQLQQADTYEQWKQCALALDQYLGNDEWKKSAPYSYYNDSTVRKVNSQLSVLLERVSAEEQSKSTGPDGPRGIEELKSLLEGCIKNNFVGVESPQLYSESYLGTKDLVQSFIDYVQRGLEAVLKTRQLPQRDKDSFFKHLELNYGRTALCFSGGATFAYYHFGVARALLDAGQLPEIITGTSGGALVASLIATRTNEELKDLLVPALAYRIRACHEGIMIWSRRWWRTGARFDSLDWAKVRQVGSDNSSPSDFEKQTSWFTHGSLTFREAYQRTGRILNVTCVPSDPHSPVMLNNHITSPDCVIWSAVLASAAVPGILNPIVLMRKTRHGILVPYSFGNKWKDGSLRTDIPLKSLNIHFNVNFSIVSQVNPHINLFFFSPRGSPGRPVTHRKGRGWRGGFLGSSLETAIKLDLQKYLKILRHLELLPRLMGQDWSEIWLQRFSGTITIWPKTVVSDFWNILSDPSAQRLARMIRAGERSCWPKIRFISNRMKIENIIIEGLRQARPGGSGAQTPSRVLEQQQKETELEHVETRLPDHSSTDDELPAPVPHIRRQSSILEELSRQASVLWANEDESHTDVDEGITTDDEDGDKDDTMVDGKHD